MITCKPEEKITWLAKLFMVPFFLVHYGGFTAVHGVFVFVVFGQQFFQNTEGPRLDILYQLILDYNLLMAMLALFISHGYSFVGKLV